MQSVDILKENNIKLPMIIEIALKLGIDLKEYSTEELIIKIKNKFMTGIEQPNAGAYIF